MWYRCPQGHILELPKRSTSRHHYCELCKKIYVYHSKGSELVRLVKAGRHLVDASSKAARYFGQEQRQRCRSYRESNSEEIKSYATLYRIQNRDRENKRVADWKKQNRVKCAEYNRNHKPNEITKSWKKSWNKAMMGLAMLGLPINYKKQYRIRKKLQATLAKLNQSLFVCPICSHDMTLRESGVRSCPSCKYWAAPTPEILAALK